MERDTYQALRAICEALEQIEESMQDRYDSDSDLWKLRDQTSAVNRGRAKLALVLADVRAKSWQIASKAINPSEGEP